VIAVVIDSFWVNQQVKLIMLKSLRTSFSFCYYKYRSLVTQLRQNTYLPVPKLISIPSYGIEES
jgi:hypothetical protein